MTTLSVLANSSISALDEIFFKKMFIIIGLNLK